MDWVIPYGKGRVYTTMLGHLWKTARTRRCNQRWTKARHTGDVSNALFYQVRAKLGIKTEWVWVKESEPEAKSTLTEARGQGDQLWE
jgi:hypothetical protein